MEMAETPRKLPPTYAGHAPKLTRIARKLLTALSRDCAHILATSASGKLDKASSDSLVNYMKLLKTLQEEEKDNLGKLSEEDLLKELDKKKNGNT